MWVLGLILFGLYLACNKQSNNKKLRDNIRRMDNDPTCTIKSNDWYAKHPEERKKLL